MKFKDLIKNNNTLRVIEELGYDTPTKIQEEIIPLILDGNDVLGQSQTGTGKTIAFALPILENIEENNKLQTLILAPTRELAIQIERDIKLLAKNTNIKLTCVYGSSSMEEQIKNIRNGAEIVVGTPGRVKDLINRRVLKLSEIRYFVLDEADEMLSMGFEEEIDYIFNKVNNDRQVMLFSATMPKTILKIAENYMSRDYKMISIKSKEMTADNIEQEYYVVNNKTKTEALCRILDYYNPNRSIIFCRTKRNVDELLERLISRGYSAEAIHGDITQGQRIATLDKFKAGLFKILIATDVAARGIHVDDVDIVFNYNIPESNEAYVHRIGRTGRANKSGMSITLVTTSEEKTIRSIETHVKSTIVKKLIPDKTSIMSGRINDITNMVDKYKDKSSDSLFSSYVDSLDNDQKNNILNKLLNEKLGMVIGSDFLVDITVEGKKKKHGKRQLDDATRVFLTIGKLDKIDKRDFLLFLERTAKVKEGTFTGMEILSKFTFMNVNNKYLNDVLTKCNNIKYNDRLIRIEIAKK